MPVCWRWEGRGAAPFAELFGDSGGIPVPHDRHEPWVPPPVKNYPRVENYYFAQLGPVNVRICKHCGVLYVEEEK